MTSKIFMPVLALLFAGPFAGGNKDDHPFSDPKPKRLTTASGTSSLLPTTCSTAATPPQRKSVRPWRSG